MNTSLAELYKKHHADNDRFGYTIFEKERSEWILSQFPDTKPLRLLDLGCRDATLTRHYEPFVQHITGVDIDHSAVEEAKKKLPKADIFQMDLLGEWRDLQDKTFDVITCSEVLEHVYYPRQVVEKLNKHLASGGCFIGTVPNAFFLKHRLRYFFGKRKWTPLADPTHITQFNQDELIAALSAISGEITISGYTRWPWHWLAKRWPSVFAFDFYFCVKKG